MRHFQKTIAKHHFSLEKGDISPGILTMTKAQALHFDCTRPLTACRPPWWAASGHLQTVLGHLLPSAELGGKSELITLDVGGGDQVIAHFYQAENENPQDKKLIYLFH